MEMARASLPHPSLTPAESQSGCLPGRSCSLPELRLGTEGPAFPEEEHAGQCHMNMVLLSLVMDAGRVIWAFRGQMQLYPYHSTRRFLLRTKAKSPIRLSSHPLRSGTWPNAHFPLNGQLQGLGLTSPQMNSSLPLSSDQGGRAKLDPLHYTRQSPGAASELQRHLDLSRRLDIKSACQQGVLLAPSTHWTNHISL